jgi:hypothetical protein
MVSVLLIEVGPAPKPPAPFFWKTIPPVEVSEVVPSFQVAEAVPLRVAVFTEAGLAFGAPAGENVVLGNGEVATVTVKAPD